MFRGEIPKRMAKERIAEGLHCKWIADGYQTDSKRGQKKSRMTNSLIYPFDIL